MTTRPLAILAMLGAFAAVCPARARAADDARSGSQPVFYTQEVRQQYAAFGDSGAALLQAGKIEEALAAYAQMEMLIPGGPMGQFNRARAYGHAGRIAEAIDALDEALTHEFDSATAMQNVAELAQVLRDPRGEKLIRRAQQNSDKHLAFLSRGLPAVTPLPVPADSVDAYVDRESRRIYEQYGVWHPWQIRQAMVDLRARQLENWRTTKKDDPQFDYGLTRLRILVNAMSIQDRWGVLADGIKREADSYLPANPSAAGRAEATYYRGLAAFCRERPTPASPAWKKDVAEARRFFSQVDTTSAPAGAAAAWNLALELMAAGDAKQKVYSKVIAFSDKWAANQPAQMVANALFKIELIRARWPVPLNVNDLDGKPVTLDQYKGKLLLIDFWATWCSPCLAELPGLKDAYAKYHDRGLEVLSISLDNPKNTSADALRAWVAQKGLPWRHIYDEKFWASPLAKGFNVRSIPSPFLIGRDGVPVAMTDDLRGPNLARTIERAL